MSRLTRREQALEEGWARFRAQAGTTVKLQTAAPPAFTLREQQARFDEFRRCFNNERPYEASFGPCVGMVGCKAAEK